LCDSRASIDGFVFESVIDIAQTAGDPSGVVDDPEGIAFDPATGNLFLLGDYDIFQYTSEGVFISKFDISDFSPNFISPAGLAIGPASSGAGESFYMAERGIDNNSNSNERDGGVYEPSFRTSEAGFLPPPREFVQIEGLSVSLLRVL
jgi:hypothetical protein